MKTRPILTKCERVGCENMTENTFCCRGCSQQGRVHPAQPRRALARGGRRGRSPARLSGCDAI